VAALRPLGLLGFVIALAVAPAAAWAQVAVRGAIVHTMAGDAIPDGVVVIRDGKIVEIGPAARVAVPAGFEVLEAAVVTPGLVDARSTVGLAGALNSDSGRVRDQDQLEKSDPVQPELRAIDAYDARETLVEYVRGFGVTTLHTGHGPGATISGQTLIAKTRGETVDEAVVVSGAAVAITLGSVDESFKSPGTRSKNVALLRQAFVEAQQYEEKRRKGEEAQSAGGGGEGEKAPKPPDRNLRSEVLAAVLRGEVKALVTADSATDIAVALRLERELGFDMILDSAAEAYLLLDEIRAAGVPVFLHPPMARKENGSFETAAKLAAAGIPFAIQTGFESYVPKSRVLVFEAAIAAANGLSFEQALAAVTREPARILGIDDRVGTLEPGKDGDLVLFSGDPFEYTTQVCGVIIEGEVVSRECR
jgi:imidazolonepropionase-like amidohydrolase